MMSQKRTLLISKRRLSFDGLPFSAISLGMWVSTLGKMRDWVAKEYLQQAPLNSHPPIAESTDEEPPAKMEIKAGEEHERRTVWIWFSFTSIHIISSRSRIIVSSSLTWKWLISHDHSTLPVLSITTSNSCHLIQTSCRVLSVLEIYIHGSER